MVKRNNPKQPIRREEVDSYARALQALALVSVIILLIVSNTIKGFQMQPYIIPGILGIAIGLSPEQVMKLIVDIVKSALGKK